MKISSSLQVVKRQYNMASASPIIKIFSQTRSIHRKYNSPLCQKTLNLFKKFRLPVCWLFPKKMEDQYTDKIAQQLSVICKQHQFLIKYMPTLIILLLIFKMETHQIVVDFNELQNLELRPKNSSIDSSYSEIQFRSKFSGSSTILRQQTRKSSIKNTLLGQREICANFSKIQKQKTLLDRAMILESLQQHFIFHALLEDEETMLEFVDNFQLCSVLKNQYVIQQNDHADFFYIVEKGLLHVEIDGVYKSKLYPGDGFGELALLYSTLRSASIKAVKQSELWYIDRKTFKSFLVNTMRLKFDQNLSFINSTEFFASLTKKQRGKIASIAIPHNYEPRCKVFESGTRASSMFVVKSGKLKKSIRGYSFQILKKGDICEENAVLTENAYHQETLVAITKSELISFKSDNIHKVLGATFPLIICRNMARQRMMKLSCFSCLSMNYISTIIDSFNIRKIQKEEVIVYPGLLMKNLIFFVISGNYQISNKNKISEIYGWESLDGDREDSKYDYYLHFFTEGTIAYTSLESIEKRIKSSFNKLQLENNALLLMTRSHKENTLKQRATLNKCKYEDFKLISTIGKGHFAKVYKVQSKESKKVYALKAIEKKPQILRLLQNEKQILAKNINPFIMNFYASFEDEQHSYLITQYIDGMQLFTALRDLGLLTLTEARFYLAILFEAIYSMHQINIIYRDLKPENVMVEKSGYLKLIDLGTAKYLSENERTYTIIGTPSYMAPQILLGKGYSYQTDLWALGIILYEFLAGYVPFGQNLDDPYQIFLQVLKAKLQFPIRIKDDSTKDLITRLLSRQPHQRLLGCYSTIRYHPFFEDIDWQQLYSKKLSPVYFVPNHSQPNNNSQQEGKFIRVGRNQEITID